MENKIIALVGRPNVGKSTLFNRLSTGQKAIVHDIAGVTRDRKYAKALLGPVKFTIIDTPGLQQSTNSNKLEQHMMSQTLIAIKEADLVCIVVDGKEGVNPLDKEFVNLVRQNSQNYILIVNKCEKEILLGKEYYELGIKDIISISAEHNVGMMGLYEVMHPYISDSASKNLKKMSDTPDDIVRIAVVGRPNVGKSTFINSLIKEQRLTTDASAGTTRESIEIHWQHKQQRICLIDTAGLRKRKVINQELEKLSASDTINSIKFANTIILMLDATGALEQQDLIIANHIIKEGRSLVLAINKSDLIFDKQLFKTELLHKLDTHLPQVKGLPIVFISAIRADNLTALLDECIKIYDIWNKKISTSKLNQWLERAVAVHPLPLQKNGRRVTLKYITQTKIRPPTFKLFSNNPAKILPSYQKYLINNMREVLDLPGVPIRLIYSKTKNPYVS